MKLTISCPFANRFPLARLLKRWRSILLCVVLIGLSWQEAGQASPLLERLAAFPDWHNKVSVGAAQGDLIYPAWFAGTWEVSTTLVDLVAPLAPEIITPGFEGNRQFLNRPIRFAARFVEDTPAVLSNFPFPLPTWLVSQPSIVADRAFNGLNLATASLADEQAPSPVLAVKVDPQNPNRQITLLRTSEAEAPLRQLISTITGRSTETPQSDEFITTEVFQQEFRGAPSLYFNEVETTTAYHYIPTDIPTITADQVTAIYLSPQDQKYFSARETPVALYRYRLEFSKDGNTASDQVDRFFP